LKGGGGVVVEGPEGWWWRGGSDGVAIEEWCRWRGGRGEVGQVERWLIIIITHSLPDNEEQTGFTD